MKIRNGFVSNSSTSSFYIYGVCLNQKMIVQLIKDAELERGNHYDYLETIAIENDLEYHEGEYDNYYLGKSWGKLRDDETGGDFKKSVEQKIKTLLGEEVKCFSYNEAWYNG